MITKNDKTVNDKNIKKLIGRAINNLNISYLKKYEWGIDRIKPHLIAEAIDNYIMNFGYQIDDTTRFHAYDIGNNNRWDVVNKDFKTVGFLNCNDDMFGGCFVYFEQNDEKYCNKHLK